MRANPPALPTVPARAPPRPARGAFGEALGRAAAASPARAARSGPLAATGAAAETRLPPPTVSPDAGAAARASALGAVERARLATTSIAAREAGALELRFGADAVRIEAAPVGVALRVEAGPQAVRGALDPGALADAVRARGVPVARAELRAGSGARGRRPR